MIRCKWRGEHMLRRVLKGKELWIEKIGFGVVIGVRECSVHVLCCIVQAIGVGYEGEGVVGGCGGQDRGWRHGRGIRGIRMLI